METKDTMTELLKKWSSVVNSLGIKEYPKMTLFSRFAEHLEKQGIENIYDNLRILKSLNLRDKYIEFKSDLKNHMQISLNMPFEVVNEFKEKTGFNIYESSKSLLISKLINKINLELDVNEMIYINYFINNYQSDDMVREISPNYEVCRSEKTVFKVVFKGEKSELHRFIFKGLKSNTKIVIQPDETKVVKLYENTDVDKKEKDKYKTITYISPSRIDGYPIFYHDYIMSKETIKGMLSTIYKIPLELESGKIDIKLSADDFDIEIVPMMDDIMNASIDDLKKMVPPKEIINFPTKGITGCVGPDDSGFGPGIPGNIDNKFQDNLSNLNKSLEDVVDQLKKPSSEKIMSNFRFHPDVYNAIKQKSEKNYLSMTDYLVQLVLKDKESEKEEKSKPSMSAEDIQKLSKAVRDLSFTGIHLNNYRPKEDDIITRIDERFVPRKEFKYEKNLSDLTSSIKNVIHNFSDNSVCKIITNKAIFSHLTLMENVKISAIFSEEKATHSKVTFHNVDLESRVDLDHNYIYFKDKNDEVVYTIEIYDPLGCFIFDIENLNLDLKNRWGYKNADGIPLKISGPSDLSKLQIDKQNKINETLKEIKEEEDKINETLKEIKEEEDKDDKTTYFFLRINKSRYPILKILKHPQHQNKMESNLLISDNPYCNIVTGSTFKLSMEIPIIVDNKDDKKNTVFVEYCDKNDNIKKTYLLMNPKFSQIKDEGNNNIVIIEFDAFYEKNY